MKRGVERSQDQAWLRSPELWAARQYATVQLPDERLNKRLVQLASTLAAKPGDSLPQACGDWAQTKGAYRFLENERVELKPLQQPLFETTAQQCRAEKCILCVQDTTTVSFSGSRRREGLGPVNDIVETQGLLMHGTLALNEQGMPLGWLGQQLWARDVGQRGQAAQRRNRPLEAKESFKWIDGIRTSREHLQVLPARARPEVIHIFDREGDIYDVFAEGLQASREHLIIRSAQNRTLEESGQEGAHKAVREAPLLGQVSLEVPRKHNQRARRAVVQVRSRPVRLKPPVGAAYRQPIPLHLVELWEPEPPAGTPGLHWRLWTTLPAQSLEQVARIVRFYTYRWRIEEVHLVLKSGCRVEALQLQSAPKLFKALALYAPIALRIVQLRQLAREHPTLPCTVILQEDEWRALWTYMHRRPVEANTPVPSISQAVLWIGRLGGHLNRKGDGMPGVRTLWRGWRDLQLLSALYRAQQGCDTS